jgi:hypothetical protein
MDHVGRVGQLERFTLDPRYSILVLAGLDSLAGLQLPPGSYFLMPYCISYHGDRHLFWTLRIQRLVALPPITQRKRNCFDIVAYYRNISEAL